MPIAKCPEPGCVAQLIVQDSTEWIRHNGDGSHTWGKQEESAEDVVVRSTPRVVIEPAESYQDTKVFLEHNGHERALMPRVQRVQWGNGRALVTVYYRTDRTDFGDISMPHYERKVSRGDGSVHTEDLLGDMKIVQLLEDE